MQNFAVALVLSAQAVWASASLTQGSMTEVVKKLQDMLKDSQADGDKERELYAKFKCYCDTNEAHTQKKIKSLNEKIQEGETKIDKIQAESGTLSTECAQLAQDKADNEQARKEAQGIRDKANEEFVAEEKDMMEGVKAMDNAIATLSEVGADQTALLETSAGADRDTFMGKKSFLMLKSSVKEAMAIARVLLSNEQKRSMASFIQAPFTGDYTAQSGEIVGILKNMRDTFKEKLASIQAAEKGDVEAHEKFMKIKEDEFESMKTIYAEKEKGLGDNDDELGAEKEKLSSQKDELDDAEKFLAKLTKECEEKANDFEKRKMLRANEEAAISKAISILNSDSAFEAFGKVDATNTGGTGPAFLQIQQHDHRSTLRANVLELLKRAAHKQKSLKIARVAILLEAENPFDEVLKEIDLMVEIIKKEAKADKEQLDWCKSERAENKKSKKAKKRDIRGLKKTAQGISREIDDPETGLVQKIADTQDSYKSNLDSQATETSQRAEENRAYQQNIKNIQIAKELLAKAIDVLKAYYDQFKEQEELIQEAVGEDPPMEKPDMSEVEGDYKGQSESGDKVVGMLEFIAKETHQEEIDAHQAENDAQHAFEDSMTELKEEQESLAQTLAKYQKRLAEAKKELAETKNELKKTENDLKAIEKYLLSIKEGCDFITENFETRQKNRNLEEASLEKAKGLIKGTPAYKKAVIEQEQEDLGDCKDTCNAEGREHAKCKACLAGTSVPGYCAGHKDTEGC